MLLPLLEAASTHFTSVEQLLSEDRNFNALRACRNLDLSHVCEVKKAGDDEYFKLSNAKLTNWLKGRVARLQAVLDTKRISGSHQRSSQVNQVAAMNILEEYLSKDRFAALRDSYGIRDYSKEVVRRQRPAPVVAFTHQATSSSTSTAHVTSRLPLAHSDLPCRPKRLSNPTSGELSEMMKT